MRRLRIRGLGDEGPGDLVGAITGETDIGNRAIGAIEVRNGRATVEVEPGAAGDVAEALDGEQVGASRVSAAVLDGGAAAAVEHLDERREQVQMEREEEMRRHEEEIRSLSGREREDRGRALVEMRGRDEGEGLGGHLVKFLKARKGPPPLPETEIAVGDLVVVSKRDPLREDNPTGTVAAKSAHSVTVALDGPPPDWALGKGPRLDLYVNDVTYQRMLEALDRLEDGEGRLARLREIVVGEAAPDPPEAVPVDDWGNPNLDGSQREAVAEAAGAPDVLLVHGPPGTGKTTTLAEAIHQLVRRDESVLATAPSNVAVDNLVEALVDQGVDAVRVGHPARVRPAVREHGLDARLEDHPKYRRSRELRQRAFDLHDEQEDLTRPSGRWRRGMSDERIRDLAEEGEGARGVPPERVEEMARWLDLQEEVDALFRKSDALEDEAVDEVLEAADVVCTTNSTAGGDLVGPRSFDVAVVDEATQATEPSTLIPAVRADRVVLAGDHRQLPPTVESLEARDAGLDETLFERLARRHDHVTELLTRQYRMHEAIQAFPSEAFYDDQLRADADVAGHTLADLGIAGDDLDHAEVLDPAEPVVLVDTSEADAPERSRRGSKSRENPAEAAIVADLAEDLLEAGLDPGDLAVVSPYHDQVDRLRRLLDPPDLEVDTVDGFQGREKEAILASLVRSNGAGEVGFLADVRRLNVALTRARRKLVVVADAATVAHHPVYADLVDHVADEGRLVSA